MLSYLGDPRFDNPGDPFDENFLYIKRNALNGTSLEKIHRINKGATRFLLKKRNRRGRKKLLIKRGASV